MWHPDRTQWSVIVLTFVAGLYCFYWGGIGDNDYAAAGRAKRRQVEKSEATSIFPVTDKRTGKTYEMPWGKEAPPTSLDAMEFLDDLGHQKSLREKANEIFLPPFGLRPSDLRFFRWVVILSGVLSVWRLEGRRPAENVRQANN